MKNKKFKAFIVRKDLNGVQKSNVEDINYASLMNGDVTVKVAFSCVNYKDGLAITAKIPIIKQWPMIPGVDFSGTVIESKNKLFKNGDRVILNGWGVGEKHFGGYSQYARVNPNWLIKIPNPLDELKSMIIGSAGYTAMLCVMAVEEIKKNTNEKPHILVTGASGGVGSFSVYLLSKLGFTVTASTGKLSEKNYLTELGATNVIERNELNDNKKPLNKQLWDGVIDSVGSSTLSYALSTTRYGGIVASTGLAQGAELNTTVFPFILRAITLKGIDSVYAPKKLRDIAWKKLANLVDNKTFQRISVIKNMSDLNNIANKIINGKIKGRVVIDVNKV